MPVNLKPPGELAPVPGVRLGTASIGVRKTARHDLALVALEPGAVASAVFTQSAFAAAPVTVAREHLEASGGAPRFLLVNAGNANAATGQRGIAEARDCCAAVAAGGAVSTHEVLPFSTGVIGEHLPMGAIRTALPACFEALGRDGWNAAAKAIMTTDTVPKAASRQVRLDGGETLTVTGMAKGVGMICPNMATMLAFVATDARLDAATANTLLERVVARTFNRISVDGDTSTNDACVLIASGAGAAPDAAALGQLADALHEVCLELAHAIVRDGEGATKFVTIECAGARDEAEAAQVAYTIAHSPLVKTALFASDANWGRLAMAIGRAGVDGLDASGVDVWLDDVQVMAAGARAVAYTEEAGAAVFARDEFTIRVDLGRGAAATCVWTCDFSYDYVRINAEYRS